MIYSVCYPVTTKHLLTVWDVIFCLLPCHHKAFVNCVGCHILFVTLSPQSICCVGCHILLPWHLLTVWMIYSVCYPVTTKHLLTVWDDIFCLLPCHHKSFVNCVGCYILFVTLSPQSIC